MQALIKGSHRKSATTPLLFIGPILNLSALDRAFTRALINRANRVHLTLTAGLAAEGWLNAADASPAADDLKSAQRIRPITFLKPLMPEEEIEAAFALMAEWIARGEVGYRDIRLIHPFLSEELPRLKSAARRYRVPIQGATAMPLSQFSGAIRLMKIFDLFESGWGRQQVLDILRSRIFQAPPDKIALMIERVLQTPDRRSKNPWEPWLNLARQIGARELEQNLLRLIGMDKAASDRIRGSEFAAWTESIMEFAQSQRSDSDADDEDGQMAESEKAGWEALRKVSRAMGRFFREPTERAVLVEVLRRSLDSAEFTPSDSFADAVEICSGHLEDHLPCKAVLYLSLHSRVPSPGRINPFLGDSHAPDYWNQLRLFHLQIANAQEKVVLSCPQHDDDGECLAPSPFLSSLPGLAEALNAGEPYLPQALRWWPFHMLSPQIRLMTRDAEISPSGRARRRNSLQILKRAGRRWSSTQLSNAIQCLYLHFAGDVLRIEPQADAVIEAATPALLGRIAHQILQEFVSKRLRGEDYDIVRRCRERYREFTAIYEPHLETDRAEEELVRCLAHFAELEWERLATDFTARTDRLELAFGEGKRYPFLTLSADEEEYFIEGIIDRLDQANDGRVLIVEYKYRKADGESKDEFCEALLQGKQPQLPLYSLAAERLMGLQVAGLLQIFLRSAAVRGLKLLEFTPLFDETGLKSVSPGQKEQMMAEVQSILQRKANFISDGVLTAFPDDFDSCGPGACPYADLCRFRGQPYDVNGWK